MKLRYTIEIYEHGALLCAAPGQTGIPIEAMGECMPLFKKHADAVCAMGITNYYNATRSSVHAAMAIANSSAAAASWKKAIEAELAKDTGSIESRWLKGTDTGISSMAIFDVLSSSPDKGNDRPRPYYTPADADDFGRCRRLVDLMGWRARLPEVAAKYPATKWPDVIARWDEIAAGDTATQCAILSEINHPKERAS